MNEEAKNFAKNLETLMQHHGHTQRQLEAKSGVSQKTISNMLNPGDDRSPNLENVALIAKSYGLKTWHLLLPNSQTDILMNSSIEKVVENYIDSDQQSREAVLKVSEATARYREVLAIEHKKSG